MTTPGNIAQVPFGQTYIQAWPGNRSTNGGNVLFWNQDLNNIVYVGYRNTVSIGGLDSIPIPPNGMLTLGADRSVYAIAAVGTLPLVVIPGGGSFFRGLTQAQGQLVLPAIQSPNFVTGVSGWIIRKDGSVEFNNGVFRGTITAGSFIGTDFEITPLGVFFYSGVPAFGNLIISIAPPGVTQDRFGNPVTPNGMSVYGTAGNGAFLGLSPGGSGIAAFPSGAANELVAAALVTALEGAGVNQFIATAVEGPRISLAAHGDWVGIQFNSPNAGGTSFANGSLFYIDNAQTTHAVATWDNTGFNIKAGAYQPTDGNSYTPGLLSLIVPANVPVASTGTVNLGPTCGVQSGITYRIHAKFMATQGATASIQFMGFGGFTTGGGPTQLSVAYIQEGSAQSFSTLAHQSVIGFIASPAYVAGRSFLLEIDGEFTPSANGTLSLVASCTTAADPFTVIGGSFADIWQV